MSRIKVTNTAIIIDNYEFGECPEIEKSFMEYDPTYHRLKVVGMYYDKENKRLYLPAGIDLWYVKNKLNEKYYDRIQHYPYQTFDPIPMIHPPKNDRQIEILKFMCDIEDDAPSYQKSLNANTSAGKTYCSIATICYFSCKALIIMKSNSLIVHWIEEILDHTKIDPKDIVQIKGSAVCMGLLKGNIDRYKNAKIFLCSHGTLRSFGDTFGWDNVTKLVERLGIGIKIFDEAHQEFENLLMIDYFTNVWKTYYVTATFTRSSDTEKRIYSLSFKNVPNIDLFDPINDPRTHYVAIKYNSNPSARQVSACKNKYGLDRMKYVNYITEKKEFYMMLEILMVEFVKKCKGQVLMYIGTNEGILKVYYWIVKNFPEYIGRVGIFTSLLSHEEKIAEREKDIILTTTSSAGAGENLLRLQMTILLAEPFKSDVLARQSLGRTRQMDTLYIELVDLGFKYTRKFYNAKLPVFNKYALSVSDDIIDFSELCNRYNNIIEELDTWQECPIEFDHDKRFPDLNTLLPDDIIDIPGRDDNPRCPIRFVRNRRKLLD